MWLHAGGGCFVARQGILKGRKKYYPCDDQYENSRTLEQLFLDTTPDAHRKMPAKVRNITQLTKMPGVVLHRRVSRAEYIVETKIEENDKVLVSDGHGGRRVTRPFKKFFRKQRR